jgi:uncharacterized membrane protein YeaQ/YmgE (transglycosylase-associated protein family)
MSIIGSIVVGAIAGTLGKWIMPGKDPSGYLITIGLGIAGAVVAGFLGGMIGIADGDSWIGSIVSATIGAIILLGLYRLVMKPKT